MSTATAGRMSLSNVAPPTPGPDRIFLVGVEGVGKTTFGYDAPDAVFICSEDGLTHLPDANAFPPPKRWAEIGEALDELINGEHDYKTLVIDSVDWCEPLLHAKVCGQNAWANIEEPGYGKGFTIALDSWRNFVRKLDELRAKRGMEIILISHYKLRSVRNPGGEDYQCYEPAIHSGAAGLLQQWADTVLWAEHEHEIKKGKQILTGNRVVRTVKASGYHAKNRWNLPVTLPLSYSAYSAARDLGRPRPIKEMIAEAQEIFGLLPEVDGLDKEAIREHLNTVAKDPRRLSQALNRLRVLAAEHLETNDGEEDPSQEA